MRIATGGISHETNTFADTLTTLEDFERRVPGVLRGPGVIEGLRGTGSCTGAFIAASEKLGFELAPLLWTFAQPSGLVAQEVYDALSAEFITRLEEAMPVDGVLLGLHGAMVTEQIEDAEGDLISRVREVVGPDAPIIATLDLHANITPLMVEAATALFGYDTYPHIDHIERGTEAAQLMVDTIEGRVEPVIGYRQIDMLLPPPKQCTLISPMRDIFALVHAAERRFGVLAITMSGGFPFSDIHDVGASVVVHTAGDADLAQSIADELAEAVWERKDEFSLQLTPVEDAIAYALKAGEGPVIMADGSDNPGGGAPCDGTVMLEALIKADAPRSTVAIIADPEAVEGAFAAGVGSEVTITVGGKTDDRHGKPLELTGYVRLLSDGLYKNKGSMMTGMAVGMGRTAVFVVGGVEVILTSNRIQPFDMQALRCVGIEPTDRLLIGLKSAVHYRADFQPIARAIFEVDTPGVHRPVLTELEFKRVRRPIWPLEG